MSNIISIIIAFIFILFAAVQYNDPDWYIWIPAYFVPAIYYLRPALLEIKWLFVLVMIGFVVWTASYVPSLMDWIKNGSPSITGTMKAENPEIELIREIFGLILCLIALTYLYFRNLKMQ